MRRRPFQSPIAGISSTIRAKRRRARSWSIPMRVISITSCRKARRSATAWRWGKKRWPGPASLRLAVSLNGRIGSRRRRFRRGSAPTRHAFQEARLIRWARGALYLYEGNKDTLYRIHGTNQPEYIGQAISSGCIRMTNEDVIDLFDRMKPGATVVVLAPGRSAWIGPIAGPRS